MFGIRKLRRIYSAGSPFPPHLKLSTDFRSVYSTVLNHWLEADAKKVLGQEYETVPFV